MGSAGLIPKDIQGTPIPVGTWVAFPAYGGATLRLGEVVENGKDWAPTGIIVTVRSRVDGRLCETRIYAGSTVRIERVPRT